MERLIGLLPTSKPAPVKVAALRILETSADPRALGPVLQSLADTEVDVATAAVMASRAFLRGATGARVVDQLTALALDQSRQEPVRLAAIRALAELELSTVAPLLAALQDDPSEAIRGATARTATTPEDPAELRQAIVRAAAMMPIAALLQMVERARQQELLDAPRAADWMAVRGAAHMALSGRQSRVALYDLRESLEAMSPQRSGGSGPLPVEFLAAVSMVGDRSCLEAIAGAWERTPDEWWRRRLADTFRLIVEREHVTKRHAVMKKIERKSPGVLRAIR